MKPEAFILHANGTTTPLPEREPTLEELQKAVGGYIEIYTSDGSTGRR